MRLLRYDYNESIAVFRYRQDNVYTLYWVKAPWSVLNNVRVK